MKTEDSQQRVHQQTENAVSLAQKDKPDSQKAGQEEHLTAPQ